jgi:hypothetical protein
MLPQNFVKQVSKPDLVLCPYTFKQKARKETKLQPCFISGLQQMAPFPISDMVKVYIALPRHRAVYAGQLSNFTSKNAGSVTEERTYFMLRLQLELQR